MNQKYLAYAFSELVAKLLQSGYSYTPLSHPGTGRIYRFTGPNDRAPQYALKIYERGLTLRDREVAEIVHHEVCGLWNIERTQRFRFPRLYGAVDNMILMEFMPGKLFQSLHNELDQTALSAIYRRAVVALAAVHSSIGQVKDRRFLPARFREATLAKRLPYQVQVISGEGLRNYEGKIGSVGDGWAEMLKRLPLERVISDLAVTSGGFLSQGDFKPDNLLVMESGEICVLDWAGVCKAKPWYDLAYLLLEIPREQWDEYVQLYLDEMRKVGFLTEVTPKAASPLLVSGTVFQQIARAKANVKYMATRDDPHHLNEFRAALDGLVSLLA